MTHSSSVTPFSPMNRTPASSNAFWTAATRFALCVGTPSPFCMRWTVAQATPDFSARTFKFQPSKPHAARICRPVIMEAILPNENVGTQASICMVMARMILEIAHRSGMIAVMGKRYNLEGGRMIRDVRNSARIFADLERNILSGGAA
ncbi:MULTISPECIES: hypothetical protein [Azospirillum]|uniref:Uncharacterized protein n=1 Tax=Azospirillum brasilense TaxID=192 RepID=A0ABU4P0B1_AZOBR|nr:MULTISPECIES: hypothetical protein [Azospirillum]MDW7555408.1 hypothetical protein [Azospirillum brasilense]MDW7630337.1 hypothetical protein [Azospirillum brasilense]MDX5949705.1 hypothetical protein [Azospirillum brasilense]